MCLLTFVREKMDATATTATTDRLDRPGSAVQRVRRASKGRAGLLVTKVTSTRSLCPYRDRGNARAWICKMKVAPSGLASNLSFECSGDLQERWV